MTWVAVGVGVAGAATSAYGSNQAGKAAEDAAKGQADAANQSYAQQQALMRQQRQDSAPYRNSGYNALNQLNYLMGLGDPNSTAKTQDYFDPDKYAQWRIDRMKETVAQEFKGKPQEKIDRIIAKRTDKINKIAGDPAKAWADYNTRMANDPTLKNNAFWKSREGGDATGGSGSEYGFLQQRFNNDVFEKDPGYQFRMDEGNKAVQGSAAAQGGLLSGAAMKAMQKYSQGFASNEYGNAYNRFTGDQQNMYNRLAGIAGTGQQQMNQTAQMNQQGLNDAAGYRNDAAAARASGIVGANNARQSGYGQIGNTLMDVAANWNTNQRYQQPNGGGWDNSGKWGNGSNGYGTAPDGMQTDYGN